MMLLKGLASRTQCSPPSVVSQSDEPKMKPCVGLANRIPHTALVSPGKPNLASGAGSPAQAAPRFSVRTRDVHGCTAQGAVPSTNPSRGAWSARRRPTAGRGAQLGRLLVDGIAKSRMHKLKEPRPESSVTERCG